MPTLNKLEYLDETKGQIRTALNTNFNSGITEEDTFRSYVSKISDIYTNWPKVEGEGTGLSLSNTKKGLMNLDLKGNTYQYSTTGKNFFHQEPTTTNNGVTYTKNSDGSYNISGTASPEANLYTYIPISESELTSGETYTLSVNKTFTDAMTVIVELYNGNTWVRNLIRVNYGQTSSTATIDLTGGTTVRQTIRVYNGRTININNLQIQLEKSSTATDYEPYTGGIASPNPDYPQDIQVVSGDNTITVSNSDNTQSTTYPISLGNIELCKIGNYQDSIVKDNGKWYLNKQIGKVVLDGSEDGWAKLGAYGGSYLYYIDNLTDGYTNYDCGIGLSNYFEWLNDSGMNNFPYVRFQNSNGKRIYFSILDDLSLADFKTWLSTHNTTVYYVLATPTYTEITDTTLLSQLEALAYSYDEQTNISQVNDDLGFIISASALMKGGN